MKAAYIYETGKPEVIRYGDLPNPAPGEGQALVRVRAVSVNPIDTYIRSGAIPMERPQPYVLGCDLSGVVEALGPGASRFRVGDDVWGSNQGLLGRQGAFSELAAVDDALLYPKPAEISHEDAAAASLVGITAHLGLFQHGQVAGSETVFVNGGSGAVGAMVLQMAKIAGARVVASAGSDEKCQGCLDLGADAAVNYKSSDLAAQIASCAPNGVDLWWETAREPNFDRIVNALAQNGRIVLMAGRAARPEFPVGPFYVKGCSMRGFVMFMASPEDQRRCAEDINGWLASGKLKARIDRILPLSETAAAHALQEQNTSGGSGTLSGKIVLNP